MQTDIRKWGHRAATIIPPSALTKSGLHLGDTVDVVATKGHIILKQAGVDYTLESLLAEAPEEAFALDEEDRAWLNDAAVGEELG